ncbi:hypothetical protein J2847_006455 [Azospirillum agricola]|uniref:hypothetical protein n=1 Tax=Azospirillum agricola TaxID=1720247 RepID=UPI001AE7ED14|nr:hypothetical protein [Azospirillum agricola]MBP2233120.1 hypothetical protein [Azospirillum agricola]
MSKDTELFEKLDTLIGMVRDVQAEQRRHAEAIAELRGEMRGLSSWLSSMDQRFVAIMRPYEPPAARPAPPAVSG